MTFCKGNGIAKKVEARAEICIPHRKDNFYLTDLVVRGARTTQPTATPPSNTAFAVPEPHVIHVMSDNGSRKSMPPMPVGRGATTSVASFGPSPFGRLGVKA